MNHAPDFSDIDDPRCALSFLWRSACGDVVRVLRRPEWEELRLWNRHGIGVLRSFRQQDGFEPPYFTSYPISLVSASAFDTWSWEEAAATPGNHVEFVRWLARQVLFRQSNAGANTIWRH
jgi:hypothetical protein